MERSLNFGQAVEAMRNGRMVARDNATWAAFHNRFVFMQVPSVINKEIVPKMTFMTNSVEYVTPNYNYIRPADGSGFSKYVAPQGSLALVWKNYFKKPQGLSFNFPVIIYVDATTGEMLGGAD